MDRAVRFGMVCSKFEFDLGIAAVLFVSENIDMIRSKDVERINERVRARGGDCILAADVMAVFRQKVKTGSKKRKKVA